MDMYGACVVAVDNLEIRIHKTNSAVTVETMLDVWDQHPKSGWNMLKMTIETTRQKKLLVDAFETLKYTLKGFHLHVSPY